jgi:hypothetical protein
MSQKVNLFEGIAACKPEEQALLAALLENAHLGRFIGPILTTIAWKIIVKFKIPLAKVSFEEIIKYSKNDYLKQTSKERIAFIEGDVMRSFFWTVFRTI